MSYAKLFSSITESSLWSSCKETRLLFVSMLARANAVGFIEASVPGLARISNLTREETEAALAELMAPDPDDKSGNNEGRRIIKMDGGWGIVNYEVYRNRRDEEERREYMRQYMAQYRKRPVNSGKQSKPQLAKAEAEAEAEEEKPALALSKEEMKRQFLEKLGALTRKGSEDLLPEWLAVTKGIKSDRITAIFMEASPGILWPSQFREWRAAKATY